MKSLYARFVLFLIRPALERRAATEAATAIQVTTDCSGVDHVAGVSLLNLQAEAAQAKADEASQDFLPASSRIIDRLAAEVSARQRG